jgi:RNA polymerase sigma factor (sigma-70 family)
MLDETTAEPGRHLDIPPARGDEAALFARHHDRLCRITALNVETSRDNVHEACAFAWSQLLRYQPRRSTVFAWLRQVARREAVRLDQLSRATVSIDIVEYGDAVAPEAIHARTDERQRLIEAREDLAPLPPRERAVTFLRAAGWQYSEIGVSLGISHTRVNQLLVRADARLRDLERIESATRTPRADRLRALEAEPPAFLLSAIGRLPRASPKRGGAFLQLEWRRLALAIDDFRAAHNITDPVHPFGASDVAREDVQRRELDVQVARFTEARSIDRGRSL